ncbi:hypothetical protein T265_15902, partial [Opisthorchis viverrini]
MELQGRDRYATAVVIIWEKLPYYQCSQFLCLRLVDTDRFNRHSELRAPDQTRLRRSSLAQQDYTCRPLCLGDHVTVHPPTVS